MKLISIFLRPDEKYFNFSLVAFFKAELAVYAKAEKLSHNIET